MGGPSRAKRKRQTAAANIPGDRDATLVIFNTKRRIQLTVKGWNGKNPAVATINLDKKAVEAVVLRLTRLVRDKKVWLDPEPPAVLPKQKVALGLPPRMKLPKHLLALRQPLKRERVFAIGPTLCHSPECDYPADHKGRCSPHKGSRP